MYQDKNLVSIKKVSGNSVHGKLLSDISRLRKNDQFAPGDKLLLPTEFEKINSYQFIYSNYMANLGVLKQMNLYYFRILKTGTEIFALNIFAGKIRWKIVSELKEFNFTSDELAIIQALILSQRQDISAEISETYAPPG